MVLLLNKSLYGLKQAPRIWYLLLCELILSSGFVVLESDTSVYIHYQRKIILAVYVDDILIFAPSQADADDVFILLSQHFNMKYLGPPTSFLGLSISRADDGSITLNQSGYIDQMLARFGMTNCVSAKTPLDPSLPLINATSRDQLASPTLYHQMVGSFNYIAVYSRLDISNAVSQLSQFLQNPSITHLKAARHVLRYLKGTRNFATTYGRSNDLTIRGFTDADWGGDKNDRRSHTGYVFSVNNGPVSWTSRKQTTVATSTTEAEYMALSDGTREAIARSIFFKELMVEIPTPLILSDSNGALTIAEEPTNHQRTKHIDIRYHFIRHAIRENKVNVNYVPSKDNPADILTKSLSASLHQRALSIMQLSDTSNTS